MILLTQKSKLELLCNKSSSNVFQRNILNRIGTSKSKALKINISKKICDMCFDTNIYNKKKVKLVWFSCLTWYIVSNTLH